MSNHRNLSLDRSKHAWIAANEAKNELSRRPAEASGLIDESAEQINNETSSAKFKEYVVLVKNLPANISNSGLGQTLAFLKSKGKPKENLLLGCISKWLIDEREIYPTDAENTNANQDIIVRLQNGGIDQYRWATSEVMELITWLKLHSSSLSVKNKPTSQTNEFEDDETEDLPVKTADKTITETIDGDETTDSGDVVKPPNQN